MAKFIECTVIDLDKKLCLVALELVKSEQMENTQNKMMRQ